MPRTRKSFTEPVHASASRQDDQRGSRRANWLPTYDFHNVCAIHRACAAGYRRQLQSAIRTGIMLLCSSSMADSEIQLLMATLSGTNISSDGELTMLRFVGVCTTSPQMFLQTFYNRISAAVTRRQAQRDFDRDVSRQLRRGHLARDLEALDAAIRRCSSIFIDLLPRP